MHIIQWIASSDQQIISTSVKSWTWLSCVGTFPFVVDFQYIDKYKTNMRYMMTFWIYKQ